MMAVNGASKSKKWQLWCVRVSRGAVFCLVFLARPSSLVGIAGGR